MNFIIDTIIYKIIRDAKGNKILKFPINTPLDNIIPDIWSIIIKYLTHSFCLGHSNTEYPGYRKMSKNEFNASKNIFSTYYSKNGLQSLSHIVSDEWVTIDGYQIMFNTRVIYCVNMGNSIILRTRHHANLKYFDKIKDKKVMGKTVSVLIPIQ
jgi:hypothetical protein